MSKSQRPGALTPSQQASVFYGDAFDVHDEQARDLSAGEWFESHASDQRFVLAHLLFLMIFVLEGIRRVLLDLRDRADDVVTLLEVGEAASEPEVDELPEEAVVPLPVEPTPDADNREPEGEDDGGAA
ncbi:MAG: hypothetical protein EP330_08615 [Deltaproteobacteria bacterium]|nr:MAG: hypothetical protein EP330_08615 [Deltaproteobacteria bacterium]